MEFGERLKIVRKERGLTQEQLAQKVGIAPTTLTNYEKGNREPDVFKIKKIAAELNVSADYLLGTNQSTYVIDDKEFKMVQKYRQLDQRGQQAVLDTLNREFDYLHGTVTVQYAALKGGTGTLNSTEESQKRIDKDIEDAEDYKPPFD